MEEKVVFAPCREIFFFSEMREWPEETVILLKLHDDAFSAPGTLAERLCEMDTVTMRKRGNYLWDVSVQVNISQAIL